MSNYENYVEDLPSRCWKILKFAEPLSKTQGVEVTLLLMVASTALTVPYERLKPEGRYVQPIQDRIRFEDAAKRLGELLEMPFLSSPRWKIGTASSWKCGFLASVEKPLESWEELRKPPEMQPSEKTRSVLDALRNALAHGNLATRTDVCKQITDLVFVTGMKESTSGRVISPFRFVQVSPSDFRAFLGNWNAFLSELPLPTEIISERSDALE